MRGIRTNVISQLRRVLRDLYGFESIVRELLQNADDAGSRQLHLGWVDGWGSDVHPLLIGPTILVLNDGIFCEQHAEAIVDMDRSVKAADIGAIGKYGLGIKSVFHLCEGFFYFASDNQPVKPSPFFELFCPWAGSQGYSNWDDCGRAGRALRDCVQNWQHNCSRWFCLAIPLRRQTHSIRGRLIKREFPAIDDFFSSTNESHITDLLPLMRHIEAVVAWDYSAASRALTERVRVEFSPPRTKRLSFPDIQPGELRPISGSLTTRQSCNGEGQGEIIFAGRESLLDDPLFASFKQREDWPRNEVYNELGEANDKPEKAVPHCCVIVVATHGGSGELHLRPTVFLPVTEALEPPVPCRGEMKFELMLHGYFFLDAGRRRVVFDDPRGNGIQADWNRQLFSLGTLRLILPAIDEFAREFSPGDNLLNALTLGLEKTKLFDKHRREICATCTWVYRYRWLPSQLGEWALVPSSVPFFELPSPPTDADESIVVAALPALPEVCETKVFTLASRRRLSANGPASWRNHPDLFCRLLESAQSVALKDPRVVQYLAEFIESVGAVPAAATVVFRHTCAAALVDRGSEPENAWVLAFRKLAGSLGDDAWVRLGSVDYDAERLVYQLNTLELRHLVVPAELAPDLDGARLSLEECLAIARWLVTLPPSRLRNVAAIAFRVIEVAEVDRETLRAAIGDLQLFVVRGIDEAAAESRVSWNHLEELHRSKRLFAGGSLWVAPLQAAVLDKIATLYTPKECNAFQLLFGTKESRTCNAVACLEMMLSAPQLASPEHRIGLLRRLIDKPDEADEATHRRAMRYLLHASVDHIDQCDCPLFARTSLLGGGVESRIAQAALQELGAGWRALQDDLCSELSDRQKQRMGVQPIEGETLVELLQEVEKKQRSFQWLAEIELTQDETELLLLATSTEEFLPSWRKLPLHRAYAVDGNPGERRVTLDASACYLAPSLGRVALGALQGIVTILHRPADARLRDLYATRGLCEWGPLPQLREALNRDMPSIHTVSILQALMSVASQSLVLPDDILRDLRGRKWLASTGGAVCPKDIVDLPEVEEDLARLLNDPVLNGVFSCLTVVSEDLRHTYGKALSVMRQRNILPNREQSLELLGTCLGEVEQYRVGDLAALHEDPVRLHAVVLACSACSNLPPVFGLLDRLYVALPGLEEKIGLKIAPGVTRQAPLATLRVCVEQLATKAERTRWDRNGNTRQVLAWYLYTLTQHPEFTLEHFKALRLPSRTGTWQPIERLCFEAEGIDFDYLLDSELAKVFPENIRKHSAVTPPSTSIIGAEPKTGDEFIAYFQAWHGLVPRAMIGGFLSLLGDDAALVAEANRDLHPRSVKTVRNQINWEPVQGSMTVGANEDIHAMMSKQRFRVLYGQEGDMVRITNLLGEEFEARIGTLGSTFFVGSVFRGHEEIRNGFRYKNVRLRRFDPSNIGSQILSNILLESARVLLLEVYFRKVPQLDPLWTNLGEVHQLQLEIVQRWLLDSAWALLAQLGSCGSAELKRLMRQREELERRRAEMEAGFGNAADREILQTEFTALNQVLKRLFESDPLFQAEMLRLVRNKMERHYQYSIDSLPYELYQNADDAAAELADMVDPADPLPQLDTFELRLSSISENGEDKWLHVMHWGRAINEFHRSGFSAERGRERGYDTDLKKMLTLAASDKGEREQLVTGRFGLGFKTVFFVTNTPRVVSGELAFEVTGGLFPQRLDEQTHRRVRAVLEHASLRRDGTVIELPVLAPQVPATRTAIEQFASMCPLTLAFSRHIKRCEVTLDGKARSFMWREQALNPIAGLFVGEATGNAPDGLRRLLLFRGANNAALLIRLTANGAAALPADTPAFWVTVYTRSGPATGFAVNGSFRPDVGRTQLALSRDGTPIEENLAVARQLGVSVGKQLVECFDATQQRWPDIRAQLGLAQAIGSEEFWRSIWEVLSCAEGRKDAILKELLWTCDRGLGALITLRRALPTGLPGTHDVLTQVENLRGRVCGILDVDAIAFEKIAGWPQFAHRFPPGSLVSDTRVASRLGDFFDEHSEPSPIKLLDALQGETCDIGVSCQTAESLGGFLTRKAVDAWRTHGTLPKEWDEVLDYLANLRFQTASGGWAGTQHLLVGQSALGLVNVEPDELLRAEFAPPERILGRQYSGVALEFFLVCRRKLQIMAIDVAKWTLAAESPNARRAALKYLSAGRMAREVQGHLHGQLNGSWLAEVTRDWLTREEFDQVDQNRILAALSPDPDTLIERLGGVVIPSPELRPGPVDSATILHRIYEWWQANRDEQIRKYQKQIYADSEFPVRCDNDGNVDRVEWLSLFLLGCAQTMGPFQDVQHRDFLRLCLTRGWIKSMAQIRTQPTEWLRCWREYIDGQVERITYFQWMKLLPGLSIIANWLDEYVAALLAVNDLGRDFALDDVLNPRAASFFSGGGPDAPPLVPILGIGGCFLMRELVRNGVLENSYAHRWCYVPQARVRRIVERLNGPVLNESEGKRWRFSVQIHRFLREHLDSCHTFCGDFDIPLAIVGGQPDLWEEFLGEAPPKD